MQEIQLVYKYVVGMITNPTIESILTGVDLGGRGDKGSVVPLSFIS